MDSELPFLIAELRKLGEEFSLLPDDYISGRLIAAANGAATSGFDRDLVERIWAVYSAVATRPGSGGARLGYELISVAAEAHRRHVNRLR